MTFCLGSTVVELAATDVVVGAEVFLLLPLQPAAVMAAALPNVGSERLCRDMDEWGYTFRLGSAAAWFREDAEDARRWLMLHGLIDGESGLTYECR